VPDDSPTLLQADLEMLREDLERQLIAHPRMVGPMLDQIYAMPDEIKRALAEGRVEPELEAEARIRPDRDRATRKAEHLESFEERDVRLAGLPGGRRRTNHPQSAADVSKRLDKGSDRAGQTRECPVCRRQFQIGRRDQVTCEAHCRDLARRARAGDPTVDASIEMLFHPPACRGCGAPLWAMRPDAKYHNATCRKKAERASAERGA
jgi:hypothetical protein